ncbi:MAG TPA: DNA-directed RNA polymerase subunit alpha C-terminal domain-containing protein [Gaiellaceae bacterium]|nr:DNA-directed RNA polymerase subunit alpha C-terminal domain-containing protein [Gaiellaceae bacterium]
MRERSLGADAVAGDDRRLAEALDALDVGKDRELAAIPNFGKKSVEEVKETLAAHGLTLRGDEGPANNV